MQQFTLLRPDFFIRRSCGFTGVELLVVVGTVAILAALAIPSFIGTLERYRVRRAVEALTATIYYARTEAIRRGGHVTLRKDTPQGCATETGRLWDCGWTVFVDVDENGTFNAATDTVLQTSGIPAGTSIVQSQNKAYIKMDRWGEMAGLSALSFSVQSKTGASANHVTAICISAGGRLRTLPGESACTR